MNVIYIVPLRHDKPNIGTYLFQFTKLHQIILRPWFFLIVSNLITVPVCIYITLSKIPRDEK